MSFRLFQLEAIVPKACKQSRWSPRLFVWDWISDKCQMRNYHLQCTKRNLPALNRFPIPSLPILLDDHKEVRYPNQNAEWKVLILHDTKLIFSSPFLVLACTIPQEWIWTKCERRVQLILRFEWPDLSAYKIRINMLQQHPKLSSELHGNFRTCSHN